MPFKLIHLACALELRATPSIPHSLCQCALSTGGVNVNSTTAWAERLPRDTEPGRENEDRKKKCFLLLKVDLFTPTLRYRFMCIVYAVTSI